MPRDKVSKERRPANNSQNCAELSLARAGCFATDLYGLLQIISQNPGRPLAGDNLSKLCRNLHIEDYACLYSDPRRMVALLFQALMTEEEAKALGKGLVGISVDEVEPVLSRMGLKTPSIPINVERMGDLDGLFKIVEEAQENADDELIKRIRAYCAWLLLRLHDTFALMIHGRKMTTLVAYAIGGDDLALLQAAEVDSNVLEYIPEIKDRWKYATQRGDCRFLGGASYRFTKPSAYGKIRHRALYLLLGVLDEFAMLDGSVSDRQILDTLQTMGLPTAETDIPDVNTVTKARHRYLNNHKTK